MHELSVCTSMIREVEVLARSHGASAVSRIHIQVGPLSGVEPHLLRTAFPLATIGTVAAGAGLVITATPLRVRCPACGAETEATLNHLACARCGEWRTELISGRELILARVELCVEEETHV